MKKLSYLLLLFALTLGLNTVEAQKLGYINSAELLGEHPDVKIADSELESLQKQFADRIQKKLEGLNTKYNELKGKEVEGTITPKDFQDQAKKLREEEIQLQQEEQQLQQELLKKREQLYQPILDKINQAIEDVAKEGGYMYIFDQSQGALLFADESQNVGPKIKAKIGI